MNHGSLFSGIGGFDLAAKWMGWNNVFHCEKDKFCQKVLKYHYPESILYENITKTDFTIHRGTIDILTGGFPCQPFSYAGMQKGKTDDRYLWPEMLRAIREIQPTWIVAENVPGILNIEGGLVFEQVCIDLENEGYEVQPLVLPVAGVDAPHIRQRVWIVANSGIKGLERMQRKQTSDPREWPETSGSSTELYKIPTWAGWPAQSPVCTRNDGVSYGLSDITFPKWRNESIKALGNAIVPQVAYQIFKSILRA